MVGILRVTSVNYNFLNSAYSTGCLCVHTHTQRATDRGYLHLYGLHHNRCVLNNPIEHIMPLNTHNTPNQQVGKYCRRGGG